MATKRTADPAHDQTEDLLAQLERRVASVYKQAADEMQEKITEFFAAYKKQDAEKRKQLDAGDITEEEYRRWRLSQMARGARFEAMRDTLAERITQANEVAAAYINDATPGVYALNRNYAAYTIEQVSGNVGFTLFDEATVRRLVVDQPDLMPYYPEKHAIQRGIDLAWGKKQITANVTSGILRGQSIPQMAKDLQIAIPTMNHDSAVRAARTAVTGAQNGGRMASYKAAADMGIKVRKRWVATKDTRTRSAHGRLDGKTVDWDEPFLSELGEIMYPGDPSADPANVWNCRCTLRTVEKEGIEAEPRQMRVRDPVTGKNVLVNEMTYDEWSGLKEAKLSASGYDDVAETLDRISTDETMSLSRKVYGKADGQIYKASNTNSVTLYQEGRKRQADGTWSQKIKEPIGPFEIPENTDANTLVVTGLPDKANFNMFDSTPNYILSDGRIALNKTAKNNNTRQQIQALVDNEVDILAGIRKDGHFYRVIGSDKEIDYIKKGTVKKSVNHMTGEQEAGLSVWETVKYGGGKVVELTGDVVGLGSDGEPLLDVSTVKFVRVVDDAQKLRIEGEKRFMDIYGWNQSQLQQAKKGGYKLNR